MDGRAGRFVVMGVSGVGKTQVGLALAQALGARFVEGDDLHPESNRAKMAGGTPLVDEDRWPWLDVVAATLAEGTPPVVGACSALRRRYRPQAHRRCRRERDRAGTATERTAPSRPAAVRPDR